MAARFLNVASMTCFSSWFKASSTWEVEFKLFATTQARLFRFLEMCTVSADTPTSEIMPHILLELTIGLLSRSLRSVFADPSLSSLQ